MNELSDLLKMATKRRSVVLSVAIALVVTLVWFVAFFLPQGKKISTLNSQEQSLQGEVTQGNAKVAALRHTLQHATQLTDAEKRLQSYVPTSPGTYDYVKTLSTITKKAGANLTSVSTTSPKIIQGATFSTITVTLRVSGTYDAILKLTTSIYVLPRLTSIQTITISGGGPTTGRSTPLNATFALQAFTTAKPQGKLR